MALLLTRWPTSQQYATASTCCCACECSLAGVSRSSSIIVAYVMSISDLDYRSALDAVRAARSCASPNFGFQRQLLNFQFDGLVKVGHLCDGFWSILSVVCLHAMLYMPGYLSDLSVSNKRFNLIS